MLVINQVILNNRSSGNRQRELNLFPSLIDELKSNNIDFKVLFSSDIDHENIQKFVVDSKDVVKSDIPSIPSSKRTFKSYFRIPKILNLFNAKVFHTSYYPVFKLNTKIILTVNDLRFHHYPNSYSKFRYLFLKLVVGYSVKNADHIISISNDTKNDLIKFYNLPPSAITVCHIPYSTDFFDKCRNSDSDMPYKNERYLLYVGHIEPRKNLYRTLSAYRELLEVYPDLPMFVILGKENTKHELYNQFSDLIKKNKLSFTGYVDDKDMTKIYKSAHALIFTSIHEGFGVPLLEAMCAQIPILTSDTSAMPEVALDAAVYCNPFCINSIKSGLYNICFDEDLRISVVNKANIRIQDFRPDIIAKKYVSIYKGLL